MEHLTALVRLVAEGGWRIGVPVAMVGLLIIAANSYGLPEPGAVVTYLGSATLCVAAGIAFTAVSGIAQITSRIFAAVRSQRFEKVRQRTRQQEMMANLQTLNFDELSDLRDILKSDRGRVLVPRLSRGWRLVEKGILQPVAGGVAEPICEVPGVLISDKEQVLLALDFALRKGPPGQI